MEAYQSKALAFIDELDKKLVHYDSVEALHKKTGVKRAYLVMGIALFAVSFILFGFGAGPLCNLVGFAYPLYASFKAINSENTDDDSQWLTYWVVFALFTVVESFTDLFLYWIPFYHLMKMAFLVWCYLPHTMGALGIYKRIIEPFLIKHERVFDADLKSISNEIKSIKKELGGLDKAAPREAPQKIDDHSSAAAKSVPPAAAPEPVHPPEEKPAAPVDEPPAPPADG